MSLELPKLPRVPLDPRELGELAKLMFEWPIRRAPRLTLPLCIILAAAVQTAMVVIFSIGYEAPAGRLPIAPRFYFLPPDSAAARQLGAWLDANDPALFSPGRATASAVPPPPPLKYRPSYEEPPPPLHPLPQEEDAIIAPPQMPVSTMAASGSTLRVPHSPVTPGASPSLKQTDKASPMATVQSSASWMDDLSDRIPAGDTGKPMPQLPAPKPSLYQVAVGPEGMPLHCILTDSSGDASADEAGRIWIMSRRFQPAQMTSWGRVLIPWEKIPQRGASPAATP
jgi:hypothetical protein